MGKSSGKSIVTPFVVSALALGIWLAPGTLAQSASVKPAPLRIDHALICTSDLSPAQQGFVNIGLAPDYGGHHGHALTQMAQLGFPDGTYIGIEAPVTPGAATGTPQSDLMLANAGACGWAITTQNLKAELARISALGVSVGEPEARSRQRPDGTIAQWRSVSLGPGTPGSNLPFLMEDKAPRANRVPRPSPSTNGSGVTGVTLVILGVTNLDESAALFRKVFGWPAATMEEHPEFGAKLAYFKNEPVILAVASGANSWVAERIAKFGPCPLGYLLGTSDFQLSSLHFSLPPASRWFGLRISWFDEKKLGGIRLGIAGY